LARHTKGAKAVEGACAPCRFKQLNGARQFKPLTRAEVSITRFSSRQPDFDGMVSAGKSLLDGLVEAQVLIDDSQQVIGQPKYYWEQSRPGKGKVRVRVEALA
jgi:Holliday junction resolvase RusA-like endonuclease